MPNARRIGAYPAGAGDAAFTVAVLPSGTATDAALWVAARATSTGPARIVTGPLPRRHRTAVSRFQAGLGTGMLRLRPRGIEGHRLQRLNAAS